MLRLARSARVARHAVARTRVAAPAASLVARRFVSEAPKEVFTRLHDEADPQRTSFFEYTWGLWLTNDKLEKARRNTKFLIEGITDVVKLLKGQEGLLPPRADAGIRYLDSNVQAIVGAHGGSLKLIASIHEGKHHRIYKIILNEGDNKLLVLRIPYKLELDEAIATKIKSEAATLDFLREKLGLNVPRVLAYAPDKLNAVKSPFMLMEYIEGDLLMKKWNPLAEDSDATAAELQLVVDPILDFTDKVSSVTFAKSGSLYFADDVAEPLRADAAYEGETDANLAERWKIGPSIEQVYARGKRHLSPKTIGEYNGPWAADAPEQIMVDAAAIEGETAKHRLGQANAGIGGNPGDADTLQSQIAAFEHVQTMAPKLLLALLPLIMNVGEQFKPRMYLPDLDPLNVIELADGAYFVDFEYAVIKPFILQQYPGFIAYSGAKIYDLENDVPEYATMEDYEQAQYKFMYFKTRNERMWEVGLNQRRHDLIAVALPHIKALKAPYTAVLDIKNDRDYLYAENAIVSLQPMWELYVANQLCNTEDPQFPIKYTKDMITDILTRLEEYQLDLGSQPFAATGGWVPQDMFVTLRDQGILVQGADGNWSIATDKVLEEEAKDEEK